jgi:hypothetical protein
MPPASRDNYAVEPMFNFTRAPLRQEGVSTHHNYHPKSDRWRDRLYDARTHTTHARLVHRPNQSCILSRTFSISVRQSVKDCYESLPTRCTALVLSHGVWITIDGMVCIVGLTLHRRYGMESYQSCLITCTEIEAHSA